MRIFGVGRRGIQASEIGRKKTCGKFMWFGEAFEFHLMAYSAGQTRAFMAIKRTFPFYKKGVFQR